MTNSSVARVAAAKPSRVTQTRCPGDIVVGRRFDHREHTSPTSSFQYKEAAASNLTNDVRLLTTSSSPNIFYFSYIRRALSNPSFPFMHEGRNVRLLR